MENDPETMREEIAETRARIADTAEALAYKTDIPARVHDELDQRVDRATVAIGEATTTLATGLIEASSALAASSQTLVEAAAHNLQDASEIAREKIEIVSERVVRAGADVATSISVQMEDAVRANRGLRLQDKPFAAFGALAVILAVGLAIVRFRKKRSGDESTSE